MPATIFKVAEEAADEARKQGETVAVLRIGDPCISSGLAGLLKVFHDFEVKIVPGISSIQLAAAAAQINIDESVIISFHEDGDDFKREAEIHARCVSPKEALNHPYRPGAEARGNGQLLNQSWY